jgi:hypothetical protein
VPLTFEAVRPRRPFPGAKSPRALIPSSLFSGAIAVLAGPSLQFAQVAQVVAQDLHAQHVGAAAWACHAAALARLFLASLSPFPGSALPLFGSAGWPQVFRALALARRASQLARAFPFAPSLHPFMFGLAEPFADAFA